jgi:phosphoribosyl 1,2-cyclic phosphodiesterase
MGEVRFCVLGSGSSGNAAVLQVPGGTILIDAGFVPTDLEARLATLDLRIADLHGFVLTHTHGDHIKRQNLKRFSEAGVPFYCHAAHVEQLSASPQLRKFREKGLLHLYKAGKPFEVAREWVFHALELPHDCPPTFGFRVETARGNGQAKTIGYLADLGFWQPGLEAWFADADLLALEFNHDVDLQRGSGRHPKLINRVLGDGGHLSNRQAAEALEAVLRGTNGRGPAKLVQMHLSGECNRPALAFREARAVVERCGARTEVFSSRQDQPGRVHQI